MCVCVCVCMFFFFFGGGGGGCLLSVGGGVFLFCCFLGGPFFHPI